MVLEEVVGMGDGVKLRSLPPSADFKAFRPSATALDAKRVTQDGVP